MNVMTSGDETVLSSSLPSDITINVDGIEVSSYINSCVMYNNVLMYAELVTQDTHNYVEGNLCKNFLLGFNSH